MLRQYILNSTQLGEHVCQEDPIGWDDLDKTLIRNPTYLGVFRKYTDVELEFFGSDLQYLHSIFEMGGGGTEAIITVKILRKKDYYDEFEEEFRGIAKLNPFSIEYKDNNGSLTPYVKISFEDSSFHTKFETREDLEVNTGNTETSDGLDIGEFPEQTIQIKQRLVTEENTLKLNEDNVNYFSNIIVWPEGSIDSDGGHVLPLIKISGDSEIVSMPIAYDPLIPSMVVEFVDKVTRVLINYDIGVQGNAYGGGLFSPPDFIKIVIRRYTDIDDLSTYTETVLTQVNFTSTPNVQPYNINIQGSQDITLNPDEALSILYIVDTDGSSSGAYGATYTKSDVNVSIVQYFDEYQSKCHWRFDYMKRIVQLITDQNDCFKSSVFDDGGTYHDNVVMSGLEIRGFETRPVTAWKDAFKSVRSIWNLGCGIERVDRKYKVVIEEVPYFFRGKITRTLHFCTKIKKSVAASLTYASAKVGYEKSEYEEVNGLEEYNNKSNYSTFIKSQKGELDLISTERADSYGIEFARRAHKLYAKNVNGETVGGETKDTKYDDEIFTSMVFEQDGILFTKSNEDYSSVENIANPESAGNLDITPQRNLIRNGDWLKAGLLKYPNEYVRFISADKETDLISTKTGGVAVAEQSHIQNKDLLSPLWINEYYECEAELTPEDLDAMEREPYGLIKFSPFSRENTKHYLYGWIVEVKGGGEERKGQLKLLRANLSSHRLILDDPTGISPSPGVPPLPPPIIPEEDEGGFDYVFEFLMDG